VLILSHAVFFISLVYLMFYYLMHFQFI